MVQIKLFVSDARATDTTGEEFQSGRRYSLLLFSRQERDEEPDYQLARAALEVRGWEDISLTDSSALAVESLNGAHPAAQACYEAALNTGFAALVFTEAIE